MGFQPYALSLEALIGVAPIMNKTVFYVSEGRLDPQGFRDDIHHLDSL